jgi:hypothetical protein
MRAGLGWEPEVPVAHGDLRRRGRGPVAERTCTDSRFGASMNGESWGFGGGRGGGNGVLRNALKG